MMIFFFLFQKATFMEKINLKQAHVIPYNDQGWITMIHNDQGWIKIYIGLSCKQYSIMSSLSISRSHTCVISRLTSNVTCRTVRSYNMILSGLWDHQSQMFHAFMATSS